jgi:hypothetical protein
MKRHRMKKSGSVLSPAQASAYVELREIGASPKKADAWVRKRVTTGGKVKRK